MYDTKEREYGVYAEPRQPYSANTGMGGIVLSANTLFAIVIIIALLRNQASAVTAIIVGSLYYAGTTCLFLLIASGTLSDLVRTTQVERTQRDLHRLQFTVYQPPADPLPEPSAPQLPVTPNFVSPDPDAGTRREAVAWLMQLYDERGQPDPEKVLLNTSKEQPGRIRIGTPSKPAVEWLVHRRIVKPLRKNGRPNGYALSMRYSIRDSLAGVL